MAQEPIVRPRDRGIGEASGKRVGCTEGQGYLFGKPQPAKDARALLASQSIQPRAGAAQTQSVTN
jgi:predicted signal transduction protein with EAL and GGDEF domain